MIFDHRIKIIPALCIGLLLFGCIQDRSADKISLREYPVNSAQVFLSLEDAPFLGRPIDIKSSADGLFIVDGAHNQIIKVDAEGNRLLSFGKRGRGPGELQSIAGFWPFKDEYLVYDYNSFKFLTFDHLGRLIDEELLNEDPIHSESEFNIPITLDALSSKKLIMPTGGRKGSLFAIADRINGDVTYAGKAVGKAEPEYNNQDVTEALSGGEIPEVMLNMVLLSSSSDAIYSLQQTTGILEKYTHTGEHVWEMELNIPAQKHLFDRISDHNRGIDSDGKPRLFIYARAMDAREGGVALQLNMPDDQPFTIAWVPEDGTRIDLIKVEGITPDAHGFMEGFTVSPDGEHAYYLKRSTGMIFQFIWPL
jgi:hypothetical protein